MSEYDFCGRTSRRHCAEILQYLGFRRLKHADREALTLWIAAELCPTGRSAGAMLDEVFLWCRDRRIYGPSLRELERLVRSQRQCYFDGLVAETSARLSKHAVVLLEASIAEADGQTGFNTMRGDAGQASLDNILCMTEKLAFMQRLDLPQDILATTGKVWVEHIVRRVAGEKAWEMRRHAPAKQIGLYAIYLSSRQAQLTDALVDLLIETIHKIGSRSKRPGRPHHLIDPPVESAFRLALLDNGRELVLPDDREDNIADPPRRFVDRGDGDVDQQLFLAVNAFDIPRDLADHLAV
ncbi:DUF4158 domain-containing protein [Rhizobium mongolense]|uniref:DUF4158 domain-containing protein n=1 Tax=Rhizobium mongolense TaxID=57676 RepID=UPI001F2F6907|nr:DUF4158 domain-containing protein [Rhizobium mongolense]